MWNCAAKAWCCLWQGELVGSPATSTLLLHFLVSPLSFLSPRSFCSCQKKTAQTIDGEPILKWWGYLWLGEVTMALAILTAAELSIRSKSCNVLFIAMQSDVLHEWMQMMQNQHHIKSYMYNLNIIYIYIFICSAHQYGKQHRLCIDFCIAFKPEASWCRAAIWRHGRPFQGQLLPQPRPHLSMDVMIGIMFAARFFM